MNTMVALLAVQMYGANYRTYDNGHHQTFSSQLQHLTNQTKFGLKYVFKYIGNQQVYTV